MNQQAELRHHADSILGAMLAVLRSTDETDTLGRICLAENCHTPLIL